MNHRANRHNAIIRCAGALKAPHISLPLISMGDRELLMRVQRAHFQYFIDLQGPTTGLVLDRSRVDSPASIAAIGFALTAYPVAVEHGWLKRCDAAAYTLKVLKTLWRTPQGQQVEGTSGFHGFFYHFLDARTGLRITDPAFGKSELSSIDTALLMAGVLFAKNYFGQNCREENQIRSLADKLYCRVEWNWLLNDKGLLHAGWTPEHGLIPNAYQGLSEAHLLYALALGSPTYPIAESPWQAYMGNAQAEIHYRQRYLSCPGSPLFVHQFPHVWIDFRGIADAVNRQLGFDYFENSRRATIAQHLYAKDNPLGWKGYDDLTWGITASDGPANIERVIDGVKRTFWAYRERGIANGTDDGTIAPTAALSSLPFAPSIVLPTLKHWLKTRPEIFGAHGFVDAFNPTFDPSAASGWVDTETIAIDQGPILLMAENYLTGFVRDMLKGERYLRTGLIRAGFSGGWLQTNT
jgi:hypothetical protein